MEGSSTRNSRCVPDESTSEPAGDRTAMLRQGIANTEKAPPSTESPRLAPSAMKSEMPRRSAARLVWVCPRVSRQSTRTSLGFSESMKNGEWVVTSSCRVFGCRPTFLGQPVQQPGVQEILGLLDSDERRRVRIVQKYQIGEHLERTVRREACEDRTIKRGVLDLQQEPAVRASCRRGHAQSGWTRAWSARKTRLSCCGCCSSRYWTTFGRLSPLLVKRS